jgi:hypothetical protein
MVRETKQKQLQTRGMINKQTITKITNIVWVWDALAFWMFGKNRMLVWNLVKVSNNHIVFLINRPILIFNLSRYVHYPNYSLHIHDLARVC